MKSPQDCYINVGATRTRYWDTGGAGFPLILIHGIGGYVENWAQNFAALAAVRRVIALDLPGHGRTDKPVQRSYAVEDLARFVKEFMVSLKIERADVIGHSLGGAVATRFALCFPERVEWLVLVAPGGLGREVTPSLRLASLPMIGELLTRPSLKKSSQAGRSLVFDASLATDELIELDYQICSQPGTQQAFLKTLRANGSLWGQTARMVRWHRQHLSEFTHPVLVIWGREDPIVPVSHAQIAEKGFPNVRVRILERCGHVPMLEHPQSFNELVSEFLQNRT